MLHDMALFSLVCSELILPCERVESEHKTRGALTITVSIPSLIVKTVNILQAVCTIIVLYMALEYVIVSLSKPLTSGTGPHMSRIANRCPMVHWESQTVLF